MGHVYCNLYTLCMHVHFYVPRLDDLFPEVLVHVLSVIFDGGLEVTILCGVILEANTVTEKCPQTQLQ